MKKIRDCNKSYGLILLVIWSNHGFWAVALHCCFSMLPFPSELCFQFCSRVSVHCWASRSYKYHFSQLCKPRPSSTMKLCFLRKMILTGIKGSYVDLTWILCLLPAFPVSRIPSQSDAIYRSWVQSMYCNHHENTHRIRVHLVVYIPWILTTAWWDESSIVGFYRVVPLHQRSHVLSVHSAIHF